MGGCLASPKRAPTTSEEEGETSPASRSPRCVAFQWQPNGNYLRYAQDGKGGVTNPYTRFYLDPSREHDGLVHIRCCYDNKYWVAQQRPHDGGWVVGTADEAEEDLSKPTCTLFEPTKGNRPGSIRLLHVQLGKYACLPSSSDTMTKLQALNLSLLEGNEDVNNATTYTVHDVSQQLVLPRYVAIKGDNGMYLRARIQDRHEYLEFSGRDIGDKAVLNTVHTNDDGTVRVKSNHFGKYWRRSPNWIWADSDEAAADGDNDTLFSAIWSGGFLALQNLGNSYFCKRLTTDGKRNCMNAGTPTITEDAKLRLEEAIVSREIYNVVFDLSEPRIYGRSVVTVATASALNGTTSSNTVKLTLSRTDREKRTWDSSVTLKLHVAATVCAGVPVIVADGNVEVSAELNGPYSWGSAVEKETTQKVAYEVTVPPKTRVTVTSTATRASCDVPFSYTQRDTLVDGRQVTYDMDDGLYTGVNCYDFKYVTSEENI